MRACRDSPGPRAESGTRRYLRRALRGERWREARSGRAYIHIYVYALALSRRSHGLPVAVFETVVSVRILTVAGAAALARLRVNGKRRRAEPGPPVR